MSDDAARAVTAGNATPQAVPAAMIRSRARAAISTDFSNPVNRRPSSTAATPVVPTP
jgi:hypothetical protein